MVNILSTSGHFKSGVSVGVSVGVVMDASVGLGVEYAWQICLLYNSGKNDFKFKVLN